MNNTILQQTKMKMSFEFAYSKLIAFILFSAFSFSEVSGFEGSALKDTGVATESKKLKSKSKKVVFINASKNREGNTATLARAVLVGHNYQTVNLVDYHIDQIGQESKEDQYKKVIEEISYADIIVIGTPIYWSSMSGYLKTFIDRLSDIVDEPLETEKAPLYGADVYLIAQGTGPSKEALAGVETIIKHICKKFFMNYNGLIQTNKQIIIR